MKNNKTIAILGGMGPQASANLVEVIVDLSSKEFGAKNDEDFPEIILDSVPVPDFISNKNNLDLVLKTLRNRVKKLNKFNPTAFAIACNTAHILLPKLQEVTNSPFISIIEEVSDCVKNKEIKIIGLLGTPVTLKSNLYQNALNKRDITTIIPSQKDQITVEGVIRNVLSGKLFDEDRKKLLRTALKLKLQGAEGIILGCTELPLIFPKDNELLIFNSIEILARSILQKNRPLNTINHGVVIR